MDENKNQGIVAGSDKDGDGRNPGLETYFMRQALRVAQNALEIGEVPVGCVIVLRDVRAIDPTPHPMTEPTSTDYEKSPSVIISHGANQVNATRDATRHSEIVAIDRILTLGRSSDRMKLPAEVISKSAHGKLPTFFESGETEGGDSWTNVPTCANHWKNTFGWGSGRVYKKDVLSHCDLYVTCEPCIMVRGGE